MEDVIEGRWCMPRNTSALQAGSIHHDATARELGYEGGIVPAAVHLEQFMPLLLHQFGDHWWRQGTLSVYVVSVTLDREPVCCYLEPMGPERALVWLNAEGESLVLRGTASLGPDARSEVAQRLSSAGPPVALRILAGVDVGRPAEAIPARISSSEVNDRLGVTTERLTCYRDLAEYGERVAPMASVVNTLRCIERGLVPADAHCVTMEGALEVQHLNGPVFCEHDYVVEGWALALAEEPKAEVLWYQADLCEPDHGPVARMIRMDRFLKETSPLWQP